MKGAKATAWFLCFLACAIGSLRAPAWSAPTPATVLLEELTWTELADQIRAGKTTIIVPIGGTEQNGPAVALGKHNARAKVLSERIARKLGNALVAPVVNYAPEGGLTPPTAHMRFPGTITVPNAAFEQTLEYAARSFRLHGFRDIVFLGDHGGYQANLQTVAQRLTREWTATPVRVHAIAQYYRAAQVDYPEILQRRGYKNAEIGTHAGLADTSLTLAVDPRLVRTDRLAGDADLDAAHGVQGDPRRATAELGALGLQAIVDQTVEAIQKAVARR